MRQANLDWFWNGFEEIADAPNGVARLRGLILSLAVQGRLVPQDDGDEPASELLKRIAGEKARLVKAGTRRKSEPLAPVGEDEAPFDLPGSWAWVRLPEIFYSLPISNNKIKTSEFRESGKHPVVDQGQGFIAGYTDESDALVRIPGPVIVFGDHTRELKYIDFDFVAGADGVKVLRPITIFEPFFLCVLRTYEFDKKGYSRHFKFLTSNNFPLPPLAEQKRIVAKVDELMALCDELEARQKQKHAGRALALNATLNRLEHAADADEFALRLAILADHFEELLDAPESVAPLRAAILGLAVQGKLEAQDPNDEPASELLQHIAREKARLVAQKKIRKSDPLPPVDAENAPFEIPESWVWTRLGDVATYIQRGKSPKYTIKSEFPVVSQKCVQWSGVSLEHAKYIEPESVSIYGDERFLGEGDLLWNSTGTGTVGRIGVFQPDARFPKVVADSHVTVVRVPSLDVRYAWIFLAGPFTQNKIESMTSGSTNQVELNLATVIKHPLPLPPLAEQKRIVARVDDLMALCDELEAGLKARHEGGAALVDAAVRRVGQTSSPVDGVDSGLKEVDQNATSL